MAEAGVAEALCRLLAGEVEAAEVHHTPEELAVEVVARRIALPVVGVGAHRIALPVEEEELDVPAAVAAHRYTVEPELERAVAAVVEQMALAE